VTALNKTVGFECGLSSNDLPAMYFVRGLLSKESVSDFSLLNSFWFRDSKVAFKAKGTSSSNDSNAHPCCTDHYFK